MNRQLKQAACPLLRICPLTALQACVYASTVRRAVSTGVASFSLRVRTISIDPVRVAPLARFSTDLTVRHTG
jgi:hypothetical protein